MAVCLRVSMYAYVYVYVNVYVSVYVNVFVHACVYVLLCHVMLRGYLMLCYICWVCV